MRRSQWLAGAAAAGTALPRVAAVAQSSAVPVRMACTPTDSFAAAYYAAEKGFFTEAGVDVTLTTLQSGPAMIEALLGNDIDAGSADVVQIGNAINSGLPLGVFAACGHYTSAAPTTLLCVAKTSAIKTAKELEGQTIAAITLTSVGTMTVREWLRSNGADQTKIKIVEMPFPAMGAALGRGTVAAALIVEPFMSSSRDLIRPLADTYATVAKSFYISSTFASRDWLAKNRETARKLTRALYAAGGWANEHRDESAAILAKVTKIDVERVRSMTRATYATSLDRREIQPLLDMATRYSLLTKPLRADQMIVVP